MTLNKAHGGGMLPWLLGLTPAALLEFQEHTGAWLDEIAPER